jgi:hypothetical protein
MSVIKYYKAVRSGTARGISGAERDRGKIVHLVTNYKYPSWQKAICGIEPRGNGWYFPTNSDELDITCEKCYKKSIKGVNNKRESVTLKRINSLTRKYEDLDDYKRQNPNAKVLILDDNENYEWIDNLPRVSTITKEEFFKQFKENGTSN